MPRLHFSLLLLAGVLAFTQTSCRTYGEEKEIKVPEPVTDLPLTEDPNAPVLQKVIGELTKGYPENRIEVCTLIKSDFQDLDAVKTALAKVKDQSLEDGFILTGVIPSIQYLGYLGKEQIILSEISDQKRRIRMPKDEQGNPPLDLLMKHLDEKCGVKDARP